MAFVGRGRGQRLARAFLRPFRSLLRPLASDARGFFFAHISEQLRIGLAETGRELAELRIGQRILADSLRRLRSEPGERLPALVPSPPGAIEAVHQFHSGSAQGDAITKAMLLTRRLLRGLGYRSEIYVEHRDPALAGTLRPLSELPEHGRYVLLLRHSMGHDRLNEILALPAPKVLVYHNITPPKLIAVAGARRYGEMGRAQLAELAHSVTAALADSAANALELRRLGFPCVAVCPLLVDPEEIAARVALAPPRGAADPFTLLFVGRLSPSKAQAELVDVFAAFRARFPAPARLVLVGREDWGGDYPVEVRARIAAHGLGDSVLLTGLVSDEALWGWYARSDLFLSLSRHEGFGVPLVEAAAAGLAVMAWPAGAVADTLGGIGLLASRAPEAVAASLLPLAFDPARRAALLAAQRPLLARFRPQAALPVLVSALARAGAVPPPPAAERAALAAGMAFEIHGHFNGSYSLAQVNRDLARALENVRPGRVRIVAIEGGASADLSGVPEAKRAPLAALAAREAADTAPLVAIFHHYPPLVPTGHADLRLAFVFWEETLAPPSMIAALEGGFDAVLAPSAASAKALADSGLARPISVIGHAPDLTRFAALWRERPIPSLPFTFLHVSSAFPRKGIDALLAAWEAAFTAADPVRLLIKTFPNPHHELASELERFRLNHPRAAPIVLIGHETTEEEMLGLYRDAGAMVLPSRGEGFNLPAAEAMAAGLPLIVTGWGGHRDFLGPDEARLVSYRLVPARSHLSVSGGLWAEPDIADLARALREMPDPSFAPLIAARREKARAVALRLADPEPVIRRLEEAAIAAILYPPAKPLGLAAVTTWDVFCGIAEYSRQMLEAMVTARPAAFAPLAILCDDRTLAAPGSAIRFGANGARVWPCWSLKQPQSVKNIAAAISRTDPDTVLIQHQSGLMSSALLAALLHELRVAGRRVLVIMHNPRQALAEAGAEELTKALKGVFRVLVHTLSDLDLLCERGLEPQASLLPHGVGPPAPPTPIRSLPLGAAPVLGSHGFLLPHKGIPLLIEAAASLRRRWPLLTLRLMTAEYPSPESARELATCRALAEKLGMAGAIEWKTDFLPRERLCEALRGCDLVALAYGDSAESASGALRTALAAGVPVAARASAVFADAEEAIARLDATEPAAMAEQLALLLADAERRRELTRRAALWMAEHGWPVIGARMAGLAAQAAGNVER